MRLLSSVAQRLFWMARYLERAEDTARLSQVYCHLIMDIPQGTELGWEVLVNILDGSEAFKSRYRVYNEQNVLKFLIADEDNLSSIRHSIKAARENVRTTRDVLPEEVWETVNELYLYSEEFAEQSVGRRNRYTFLEQVISRCQILSGMVLTTMCRDNPFRFLALGHMLERADMTTRVIDVGAGALLANEARDLSNDPIIWGSLLRTLSAHSTFQRTVGPVLEGNDVVDFVFHNATLPRSLQFCLNSVRGELSKLKNHRAALKITDRARRRLARFDAESATREELHVFIDKLQADLLSLGEEISTTWFLPEKAGYA